jgi:ubiquinone/menaquinone biosynthesis C-methylase UbiE
MDATNHTNCQRLILGKLKSFIGRDVCDFCSGTGRNVRIIREFSKKHNFDLIDYSVGMLKVAEESIGRKVNISYIVKDLCKVERLEKSYDTILCSFGLYWFADVRSVINLLSLSIKKDGFVIILEENFFSVNNTKPLFSKYKGYLEKLASLESYIGTDKIEELFLERNFKLKIKHREKIDSVHELVGMALEANND